MKTHFRWMLRGMVLMFISSIFIHSISVKSKNSSQKDSKLNAFDLYEIDPVHTFVLFKVNHQGFSESYGRFLEVSGEIKLDEKNPKNIQIHLRILTASLDTQHAQRDKHLKGPDFLNVKQFPEIVFKSKEVRAKRNNQYEISGDLVFRGKKKEITFLFQRFRTGKNHQGVVKTGGKTSFTLRRSEFGMTYMLQGENKIGDEVEVIVSIEANKKS